MATRVWLNRAVRAAVIAGALQAVPSWSLGLGQLELQSYLNEPLSGTLELLDIGALTADDIRVRLASVDDFERLGVDRSYFLTGITFTLEMDPVRGTGLIRLRSETPVVEPYIDIVVEARWPTGRLLREYTVLVDPPVFRTEVVTVSASQRVREVEGLSPGDETAAPESGAATPSGDRVRRMASDLPPGAMPSRPFSAETVDQPRAGSRYMVKRDETLWEIALAGRPSGVPVQQAMLDIQRLNPEAFINGNINRVKAGYIIYLPDADDISSGSLAAALEEVRAQNAEFAAGRRAPGVTAAATLRVSAAPSTSPAATTGTPGDRGSETGRPAAAAGSGTGTAAASDVVSADALATLTARLDQLEQAVRVKDEQIAELQRELRNARLAALEQAPAGEPPAAAGIEATTGQPSAIERPVEDLAVTPTAPGPTPGDTVQQRAEPIAAQAPASRPIQTTPAPAQPEPAFGSLPLLPLAGGAAVLLGLLTLGMLRMRRRSAGAPAIAQDSAEDVFAGVNLSKDALAPERVTHTATRPQPASPAPRPAPAPEEREETTERGGSRGYGEQRHDDYIDEAGGDALAEADIYIAYGRYLQAIELLNTAIESAPENSAYRLKLLELYVDMGELESAQEQFEILQQHGDDESVARAEELLGSAAGSAIDGRTAPDRVQPTAPPPVEPIDNVIDIAAERASVAPTPPLGGGDLFDRVDDVAAPDQDLSDNSLEAPWEGDVADPRFDDHGGGVAPVDAPGSPDDSVFSASSKVSENEEPLDFELQPMADAALDLPEVSDARIDDATSAAQEERGDPMNIDYEPEPIRVGTPDSGGAAPAADDDLLGFELAGEESVAAGEFEFEELQIEDDEEPIEAGISFEQIADPGEDDELDLRDAFSEAEVAPAIEEEDLLVAEDADQMATKLDLARAYLDMDDSDGARVILEEVVAAGNGEQQQEARELLSRLG